MGEVLGFDCDGEEIEEFRVLRYPFSSDIDNWDEEANIDPRFYCIIKRSNGECVAVSIYDDYHSKYIRRYENISSDEKIPLLIKDISDMKYYEVAFSGITGRGWFYDRNREELKNDVERIINNKCLVKRKEVK
ncbi:MAG: hypothetical protein IJN90_05070 [Bacilli bacterium]|nr:hypothetical protein [Bacilli bacterium]